MGSSPVTATTRRSVSLLATLERFFAAEAPLGEGEGVLVAFSGGPDSTALLLALTRLAALRGLRIAAAHLDHGLDPGSAERARGAVGLAARLGVACLAERREVGRLRRSGESCEEAGRRVRYALLEEVREALDCRYVATAHHADDQAETLLLRLAAGSGWEGLAGISPRRGSLVRPLLTLRRGDLARALEGSGLEPLADPTNESTALARNRVRHRLLPILERGNPDLVRRLARLSEAARGARLRVAATLEAVLRPSAVAGGLAVGRGALAELPRPLWAPALALLHRRAGVAYPPSAAAGAELLRQLRAGGRVGCDAGAGFRWESRRGLLVLSGSEPPIGPFSYTLAVPGELAIPEAGLRLRMRRGPVADWMFRRWPSRVGLALPVAEGEELEVRSRRPGDRLRPLGHSRPRRVKELLIDAGVPRRRRDTLPLLCAAGSIAWVPGIALAESCRVPARGRVWIAELIPAGESPGLSPRTRVPAGTVECEAEAGG